MPRAKSECMGWYKEKEFFLLFVFIRSPQARKKARVSQAGNVEDGQKEKKRKEEY